MRVNSEEKYLLFTCPHYKTQGAITVSFENFLSKMISLEESQALIRSKRWRAELRCCVSYISFSELGWDST